MSPAVIAVTVFLIVYAFIITEKLNRAVVALLGASAVIVLGILDTEKAFHEYIDWETIILLIGMMILVGIINKTGIFQYLAVKTAKLSGGNPVRIMIMLSALTALLSAFLDNVTTVLLIVPVTFSITRMLKVDVIPFLIMEAVASNIGGTATLIGDPPNIIIGSANKHLTFNDFLLNLAPVVIVIMAVVLLLVYLIYRRRMKVDQAMVTELMKLDEKAYITDQKLLIKSLIVLGLTILGFVLHSVIHIEAAVVAMTGATLLLLISVKDEDVEKVFEYVEWPTIFFFAGLFVLVGSLQEVGVIKLLATELLRVTGGDVSVASVLILWVSGIASAFVDNIPFVATMIPLIQDMIAGLGFAIDGRQADALWWSLSLGACLGGNGTIIGASANVVVAGLAAREKHGFSFWQFMKMGMPIMLLSLAISHLYIYLRYLIHFQ
ncbi:ArsB/NhaD family transporter [Laceyella sacchari]|uniref:ArsB/NhaD family transporter n=1 Tax=Laceyella sacchari TaxID=37482 RepID=A0ABY5U252_LACSH|nr:ArsB/NhaD family transporter [Laceyella sacchari]UWE03733.1 ArsB/NhaD family transporter [Laceyella sacchari]